VQEQVPDQDKDIKGKQFFGSGSQTWQGKIFSSKISISYIIVY
jgi:hypothetical protein